MPSPYGIIPKRRSPLATPKTSENCAPFLDLAFPCFPSRPSERDCVKRGSVFFHLIDTDLTLFLSRGTSTLLS
uniref:Uncharacterized protein n=1 Tax=Panagrellus redivivus TaxID=6233 RepID=A0A7E4VHX0_PANRE